MMLPNKVDRPVVEQAVALVIRQRNGLSPHGSTSRDSLNLARRDLKVKLDHLIDANPPFLHGGSAHGCRHVPERHFYFGPSITTCDGHLQTSALTEGRFATVRNTDENRCEGTSSGLTTDLNAHGAEEKMFGDFAGEIVHGDHPLDSEPSREEGVLMRKIVPTADGISQASSCAVSRNSQVVEESISTKGQDPASQRAGPFILNRSTVTLTLSLHHLPFSSSRILQRC
jgi:hypothetical protein